MTPAEIDLDGLLRRLHLPTVRRLYGDLAARGEEDGMGFRDYLAVLIAEEVAHRAQTRIERSVRRAGFPFLATIEEFDFTFQTSVKLSLLGSFLGPELMSEGRCLVLCGPTGLGKTHLGVAIAYRAIQNGATALFREANHLIEELSEASRQGRLLQAMEPYTHTGVLVVDELGYLTYPDDAANVLFQVVNQRHLRKRPMVFTTNKPLASWGTVLHDADLAEAIIDRVLACGRFIEMRGASYRTRHLAKTRDLDPVPKGAKVSGKLGPEFREPTDVVGVFRGQADQIDGEKHVDTLLPELARLVSLKSSEPELTLAMSSDELEEALLARVAPLLLVRRPLWHRGGVDPPLNQSPARADDAVAE